MMVEREDFVKYRWRYSLQNPKFVRSTRPAYYLKSKRVGIISDIEYAKIAHIFSYKFKSFCVM